MNIKQHLPFHSKENFLKKYNIAIKMLFHGSASVRGEGIERPQDWRDGLTIKHRKQLVIDWFEWQLNTGRTKYTIETGVEMQGNVLHIDVSTKIKGDNPVKVNSNFALKDFYREPIPLSIGEL